MLVKPHIHHDKHRRTRCRVTRFLLCICVLIVALGESLQARPAERYYQPPKPFDYLSTSATATPVYETRLHSVGQVWMALTNYGLIGTENGNRVADKDKDLLAIKYSPSFEFPAGTRNDYMYAGGLWVGGVIANDTLVSLPIDGTSVPKSEWTSFDTVKESSSLRGTLYYSPSAYAEQQFFARYSDTLILPGVDEVEGRAHKPLHVEVSQHSYAWSDNFSRQFVIVENWIRNIGDRPIDKMAFGIFMDADVFNENTTQQVSGFLDDVSGFIDRAPNLLLPEQRDPMNIAWIADNDGDPIGGTFPIFSPRGMVGLRILQAPPVERVSFNWWLTGGGGSQNWGPVRQGARLPASGGGLGAPDGDRNRYYVLTNGEIDYGQLVAEIDHTGEGWRPPLRSTNCDVADGLDTRSVLSAGPACEPVMPGDSVPFVYALCAGDGLHTNPGQNFDCFNPQSFVNSLDTRDLVFSSTWASWIYDTPGLDTDGDGYRGEYHLADCDSFDIFGIGWNCDTVFYTGDLGPPPQPGQECVDYGGAPDRAGPASPPCPNAGEDFSVETRPGEIIVRWTGANTETTRDPLSKEYDFEGYRLYVGRLNAADQYSLIASWDIVDFVRYVYDPEPPGRWVQDGNPVTLEHLRTLYGDSFDPLRYATPSPYVCYRDTVYDENGIPEIRCSYFEPYENNRPNHYIEAGFETDNIIQRVGEGVYEGEEDTVVYGIYEARIPHLNPSIGLHVSLTAFDYGDAALGLGALESVPGACSQFAIPIYSADVVEDSGLNVSAYPNPYKSSFERPDGRRSTYFEEGFEAPEKQGRGLELDEQDRRIWFINLPRQALIRIYTLDGDLVRRIEHNWPPSENDQAFLSDYSSRVGWDLVTRNTQAVVSGIYIYRVDSPLGSQTGKIVIIK
ncbi:MAG: hypothetical protein Kow0074_06820 [Candidatus Zixiibacteriota bacterium]